MHHPRRRALALDIRADRRLDHIRQWHLTVPAAAAVALARADGHMVAQPGHVDAERFGEVALYLRGRGGGGAC